MRALGTTHLSRAQMAALGIMAVLIAFLGLLGYRLANPSVVGGAPGVNAQGRPGTLRSDQPADFTLQGFDGQPIALADLRGKVVVVNFWSSWCEPCKDEAPELERTWQRYKDRGVVIVGANVWTEDQEARGFLEEQGITYPNGSTEAALAAEYGLTGIPETFIIDRDGKLVRRWLGPLTEQELADMLDTTIATAPRR
ncbi:MAG: TlpA family protein disulfide reductase [Chloroflexia bacterium]|nr:TlpA family protein disulfide reductase [Chloroflexia bacterium]